MEELEQGVNKVERKKFPNIGSFYNSDIRNNGTARRVTEAMCRLGFKESGFVRYTRPYLEHGKHDLYLFIDDGRDDIEWLPPRPNACYLVDTHLGYETRLKWARNFDYVFLAQLLDVDKMKADGIEKVQWLPLACSPYLDPDYYSLRKAYGREMDLTRRYDCAFVGYLNRGFPGDPSSHDRVEFLDYVYRRFPNSWMAFNKFFMDAAIRYVRARVGLNCSIKNDLNMRFFEIMSYGVCQLCNRDMVGWERLGFKEGEHFLGFGNDLEEACYKVQWALDNPEAREAIAEKGRNLALAGHTYEHRVMQIIKTCFEYG